HRRHSQMAPLRRLRRHRAGEYRGLRHPHRHWLQHRGRHRYRRPAGPTRRGVGPLPATGLPPPPLPPPRRVGRDPAQRLPRGRAHELAQGRIAATGSASGQLMARPAETMFDLTGRVAIVTGGGTGIGAATAHLLASQGADVAIAARTTSDLERTAASVERDSGRRCLVVPTDVKVEEQVIAMVEGTVAELGRLDILVNNAGGTRMGPLKALPTKAWESIFALNTTAAYVATREAGRHFLNQGSGAIVNISSGAGVHGVKGGAHYSASKAALQMFTTVTAAEWGRYG